MMQAGFSRLDVTPPLGLSLAGYFQDRKADGILDPIELNAVAVRTGTETVLLIAADLISMDDRHAEAVRQLIESETGIPAHHVAINCLHQHTTVRIGKGLFGVKDGPYLEVLYRKFVDAAKLALADLCEASLGVAACETAEQLSFIRRFRLKDGSVGTNAKAANIVSPLGEPDNTVRLLRFSREGGKDIALVHFCTHPDVIGGTKFSADWPGFVRRYVEYDLENVHCLLINGTQGDTNHIDPSDLPKWTSYRYGYSARMGRVIADAVLRIFDDTAPCAVERVGGCVAPVFVKTRTDGEERYDEMVAFYKAYEEGTLGYKAGIAELGEARRIMAIRTDPIYQTVMLTVLAIGEALFVGFGGEPFTAYSHRLRRELPCKMLLTGCNTNGSVGYLPTSVAFAEGGYESRGTAFVPELEELVIGKALQMSRELL